jgi:NADPH2:quinone reductase
MVKGLTVHMLVKDSHVVKAGEVVLIHAMMGGVGSLLSAWVRSLGATVIGTVGSAGKKQLALELGYEHVIDLGSEDFGAAVKAITQGKGVDVVYESIGKATFQTSLELIKKGGSMVLYGWASGMPEIDMADLEQRKIRFVSAVLNHYPAYQDKSGKGMMEVFEQVRNGVFDLKPPAVYDLKEAAKAHADLESRKTTGSIILKGIL